MKKFNFNQRFPEYGKVSILTLEQVYAFIKHTHMYINVELKNNHIPYQGLEEKVIQLTQAMGNARACTLFVLQSSIDE